MPEAQLEHQLLPSEPPYLPDGQFLHDACAELFWYLPFGQRVHDWASCDDEYLPAAQAVQCAPFTYFPLAHTHLSRAGLCVRPPARANSRSLHSGYVGAVLGAMRL